MKQSILITILSLFSLYSIAQENHFGLKGGWNISTIDGLPKEWKSMDVDPNNSFHIGGFAEIGINEDWALVGEVLFSGKGSLISIQDSSVQIDDSEIRLNYLTFPVLIQYCIGPLALQAGPEFGFQIDRDVNGDVKTGVLDPDFWDQRFDLSLVGGVNVNLGNFFIGARYGKSFTKLIEATFTDDMGLMERTGTYGKNSFWQFSVGLRLI